MNRQQLACRVFVAITACSFPQSVGMGQAKCPCQTHADIAAPSVPTFDVRQRRTNVMSRLPESWPHQWGDPVSTESTPLVAKSAFTSKSSRSTSTTSSGVSKTSDDNTSGFPGSAAYGGGSSTGGSRSGTAVGSTGGGISGGNSGGFLGSSAGTPRTSGSGRGVSGGFGGGGGDLSKSETTSDESSTSPSVAPAPILASTSISDPDPGNRGGLAEIPLPECPVPALLPEIPSTSGNPVSPTDLNPGNVSGEAPIVPEPGSIVLLSIAMAVGGASYIHRRRAGTFPSLLSDYRG